MFLNKSQEKSLQKFWEILKKYIYACDRKSMNKNPNNFKIRNYKLFEEWISKSIKRIEHFLIKYHAIEMLPLISIQSLKKKFLGNRSFGKSSKYYWQDFMIFWFE